MPENHSGYEAEYGIVHMPKHPHNLRLRRHKSCGTIPCKVSSVSWCFRIWRHSGLQNNGTGTPDFALSDTAILVGTFLSLSYFYCGKSYSLLEAFVSHRVCFYSLGSQFTAHSGKACGCSILSTTVQIVCVLTDISQSCCRGIDQCNCIMGQVAQSNLSLGAIAPCNHQQGTVVQ